MSEPPRRTEPDTVDVWVVELDDVTPGGLSPSERERAARIRREIGARRWAAARTALRAVLGRYLGTPPAEVELAARPDGKLVLASGERDRPHFNLSHSAGVGLIAVSAADVGVDVERIDPSRNLEGVARYAFGDSVAAQLARLPEPARVSAFYARWTAHEARLKLTGEGIAGLHGKPPRAVTVRPVDAGEGYAAAVAARGDRWGVRRQPFRPA